MIPTDPWDFVTSTGSGPFPGVVAHIDSPIYETLIVRLDDPICYQDIEARFITVRARHIGGKFECVGDGSVFCSAISLTEEEGRAGVFRPDFTIGQRLKFLGDVSWTLNRSA